MRSTPDGGDEGEAGEGAPLVGEVVVDELFAGAFEAVGAFFEGEQGGIADEDGGVGRSSMASRSADMGRKGTAGLPHL